MTFYLDQGFFNLLDAWLQVWGGKCSATRWGCSASHQAKVNASAPGSWHLSWRAIDLILDDPKDHYQALADAQRLGFSGIEWDCKNLHLHLDNRSTSPWRVVQHTDGSTEPLQHYLTKGGSQHAV